MAVRRDGRPSLALRVVDARLGHDTPCSDVGGATWQAGGTTARAWTAARPGALVPRHHSTEGSASDEWAFFHDVMRAMEDATSGTKSRDVCARVVSKDGGEAAAMANAGVLAALDAGCALRTTLASVHVAWLDVGRTPSPSTHVEGVVPTPRALALHDGGTANKPLVVDPDQEESVGPRRLAHATFAFDVARRGPSPESGEGMDRPLQVKLSVARHVGQVDDQELVQALHIAQQASMMYAEAMRAAVASKMDPRGSEQSTEDMQGP